MPHAAQSVWLASVSRSVVIAGVARSDASDERLAGLPETVLRPLACREKLVGGRAEWLSDSIRLWLGPTAHPAIAKNGPQRAKDPARQDRPSPASGLG